VSELTSIAEVSAALGRTLDTAEQARAAALIPLASAHIEAYTGRRFTPGPHTCGRVVRCGQVQLPSVTVDSVTTIQTLNMATGDVQEITDWVMRGNTIYRLPCGYVLIDYIAGSGIPVDVAGVAAGMVAAAVETPAGSPTSETIGPFSMSFNSQSGRVWLSKSDRAILGRYKQTLAAMLL
jgi:hypothetical protein